MRIIRQNLFSQNTSIKSKKAKKKLTAEVKKDDIKLTGGQKELFQEKGLKGPDQWETVARMEVPDKNSSKTHLSNGITNIPEPEISEENSLTQGSSFNFISDGMPDYIKADKQKEAKIKMLGNHLLARDKSGANYKLEVNAGGAGLAMIPEEDITQGNNTSEELSNKDLPKTINKKTLGTALKIGAVAMGGDIFLTSLLGVASSVGGCLASTLGGPAAAIAAPAIAPAIAAGAAYAVFRPDADSPDPVAAKLTSLKFVLQAGISAYQGATRGPAGIFYGLAYNAGISAIAGGTIGAAALISYINSPDDTNNTAENLPKNSTKNENLLKKR